MPRGVKVTYDDEWIADKWEQTHNWLTLCNEYNEAHETSVGYNTFKSHCNRELELNYHYSDEQLEWLKENYPKFGRNETCRMFNERFGTTKSAQAIKVKCVHLGLRVTEERLKARAIENTERYYKLGTIKVIGNMGVCEKTEDGWKRITDKTIGKAPKGYRTIHLDGDIWNNDPSNLRQVSYSVCGSMTSNKFWSEHPRITESGLIWCELKQALERRTDGIKPLRNQREDSELQI